MSESDESYEEYQCEEESTQLSYLSEITDSTLKLFFYDKNEKSIDETDSLEKKINSSVWDIISEWIEEHIILFKTKINFPLQRFHSVVGNVDTKTNEIRMRTLLTKYDHVKKVFIIRINIYSELYCELLANCNVTVYVQLNGSSSKLTRTLEIFCDLKMSPDKKGFINESYFTTENIRQINLVERCREQFDGTTISNYYKQTSKGLALIRSKKLFFTGYDAELLRTNFR